MSKELNQCPDCKANFQSVDGTSHEYIGGNPACWKAYSEVLAKEYGDPRYMRFHRWTVDAYAAQHPGVPEPRSIQSVNVHLLALHLLIDRGMDTKIVTQFIGMAIEQRKGQFQWLAPPQSSGSVTVQNVLLARTPEEHGEKVIAWSKSVWNSWSEHHQTINKIAEELLQR